MSLRPSASSSAPAIGNGHIHFVQTLELEHGQHTKRPGGQSRSASLSQLPTLDDTQSTKLDPDELFVKHTITEVKFIQQRLRTDADAKQEELRLMVGARYRDLLQASTSIIAIAQSSQRVKDALKETKDAILSQDELPLPQKPSPSGNNNTHLQTLQLLAAHIKLLLDAPEHLWKLIERKKYYPAAWLFLLARVVHRALIQNDDQGEGPWSFQGVNLLDQFPLIQRQWDTVSQFRSQIIHKATISLRERDVSTEDVCATLLTLYLLDSRPLTETFSVLLAQRSKTLHTILSRNYHADASNSPSSHTYQTTNLSSQLLKSGSAPSDFRRQPVSKIREATHSAMEVISQTVKTARSTFHGNNRQVSLIRRVLEYIQSESPALTEHSKSLPPELLLTTQTLSTTLPSSIHFLLLPPSLRLYKPYVDLDSSSSSVQSSQFSQKMNEWFHHSLVLLRTAIERWFSDLESTKEVWSVRTSARGWILDSHLEQDEITLLMGVLDDSCQKRVSEIWKLKLSTTLESFGNKLSIAISSPSENSDSQQPYATNTEFLFRAPPLPVLSQGSLTPVDASFQKYKSLLRRQIVGRTALLDSILSILEKCAKAIQQDLSHIKSGNDDARVLVEQLTEGYRPEANALCANIVYTLESAANEFNGDAPLSDLEGIALLGRVIDELSSSSLFISDIGCQEFIMTDFRKKTSALHNRIIDRWRSHTVSCLVSEHHLGLQRKNNATMKSLNPTFPSPDLMQSLLSLSNLIQQFGISRVQARQRYLVQTSLQKFITELTGDGWERNGVQSLYDLVFLWRLADLQGVEWAGTCRFLEEKIETNLQPGEKQDDLKSGAAESLTRMQTLLATLLPLPSVVPSTGPTDKFAALLPFGIPVPDQQFQSAIDLAKPSSRFGLLLVGSA